MVSGDGRICVCCAFVYHGVFNSLHPFTLTLHGRGRVVDGGCGKRGVNGLAPRLMVQVVVVVQGVVVVVQGVVVVVMVVACRW